MEHEAEKESGDQPEANQIADGALSKIEQAWRFVLVHSRDG